MARTTFKIEGLRELDEALKELPRATARNVLKRALTKAGQPMADMARSLAPVDPDGGGTLRDNIVVSSRIKNKVGASEYAAAMRDGLGKEAAVAALRDARRAAAGMGSHAEVYVGPTTKAFYGMFQEFGTRNHGPQPFLRPAFDSRAPRALDTIRDDLATEIEKARARLAKKAEREAAKLKAGQ